MQRLRQQHYKRYVRRLRQVMLHCPTLDNRDRRLVLLSDLPEHIRNQLDSNLGRPNDIVDDLIKTCANYADGEAALFDTLNTHEQNSLTFQDARAEWTKIGNELAMQDQLISWVRASNIESGALFGLFEQAAPQDYADPNRHNSAETIIAALWEVPQGHLPLLRFMHGIQSQPDLAPQLQHKVASWIIRAKAGEISVLAYDVASDENSSSIDDKVRIIIAIEPGKQDPKSRLTKIWTLHAGEMEFLDDPKFSANRLEFEAAAEIDNITTYHAATKAIEFYLPKTLLALPVDNWQIGRGRLQQTLAARYRVTKAPLERQDVRQTRLDLASAPYRQQKALLAQLASKPLLREMTRRYPDWEARWQQLHDVIGRSFQEIAVLLVEPEQMTISAEKGCATLTFVPADIDSYDLEDPLGVLMAEGVPLIVWMSRGDDDEATAEQIQKLLFDDHCDCIITTAMDVVDRMHLLHKHIIAAREASPAIGRNLNLIVDNPERNLPTIGRVPM